MRPYIYARRNLIHIIDVRETIRGLLRARRYLQKVAAQGSLVLLVGTKRQACDVIEQQGVRCGMPYVSDRWLGGTLTNFRTIRSRLTRLEELERIRSTDELANLLEEDAVVLHPRIPQDVPQPQRHPQHEPAARVPGGGRPAEGEERHRRGPQDGHHHRGLIDTDCDPDEVDMPIPGNDDSIRAIELIVTLLADALLAGKVAGGAMKQEQAEGAAAVGGV